MSRYDGFAVMDMSTDIVNDPKVRKLFRHAPSHASGGFVAYVATVAESWKAGRRVTIDDAWPSILPFSKPAVEALVHVGLLDRTGRVPPKTWRGWYETARGRREVARDRWRRANEKRHAAAAEEPRGSSADTEATVPSYRSSLPSVPPEGSTRGSISDERRAPLAVVQPSRRAG